MGWKYEDLSDDDQELIGFVLPQGWEYGGIPGDKIWPIFVCPICGGKNESEWGGCEHLMYIYSCENSSYLYTSDDLGEKLKDNLKKKFVGYQVVGSDEYGVPNPPWNVAEKGEAAIGFEDVFSELSEVVFCGPWTDHAGFASKAAE